MGGREFVVCGLVVAEFDQQSEKKREACTWSVSIFGM
jgi:hypothetical protein